jgi:homoserine O-acetyltransferase
MSITGWVRPPNNPSRSSINWHDAMAMRATIRHRLNHEGLIMFRKLLFLLVPLAFARVGEAQYPEPRESNFILKQFRFTSGEMLPELRVHYRTFGTAARDGQGVVRNAVLIPHGTGGSGAQFIRPEFAGELFASGGLLDASRHFIILPDGIGHGQSSKPSDGLRGHFPRYGYSDMIEAAVWKQYLEGLLAASKP